MKKSFIFIVISIFSSMNSFSSELNQFANHLYENPEGIIEYQQSHDLVEVQRFAPPPWLIGEEPPLERGADSDPTFITVNTPPEGDYPTDFEFSPEGTRFVVAHLVTQNLVVFDSDTRAVESVIALSGSPQGLALSPDNIHAVTANLFEDTISIIDLNLGQEVATVEVGEQPGVVRITSDGSTAVIGNTVSDSLSVVDIASALELREIPGAIFRQSGHPLEGIDFTEFEIAEDNTTVVFPDAKDDQIVFFNLTDGSSTAAPLTGLPMTVSLDGTGTTGLVYQGGAERFLGVIDIANKNISRTISVGNSPTSGLFPSVGINSSGTQGFVSTRSGVRIVDLTTDLVSGVIDTGSLQKAAYTNDGLYIVAADTEGSIIDATAGVVVNNIADITFPEYLAISPIGSRAVVGNFPRSEKLWVFNTNGPAGFLEEIIDSGPSPEGDYAEFVEITPNGEYAVTVNSRSQNVSIFDVRTKALMSTVPIGPGPDVPSGPAVITPDSGFALTRHMESTLGSDSTLSIININSGVSEEFTIPSRPSQIAVSPDSQIAYVTSAFPDIVWRMTLDPIAILGAIIPVGNMGSIAYHPNNSSGMALSHDGETLVTCGSFSDDISIIDTSSWQEVARVPVGDFPVRAAFSPDDDYIYVTNKNGGTISIVENLGASSQQISSIPVDDNPITLVVQPNGERLYVNHYSQALVTIIDLELQTVIETIPIIGSFPWPVGLAIKPDGRELYIAIRQGDLHTMDTETNTLVKSVSTNRITTSLAYSPETGCVVMAQPEDDDGITHFCPHNYFFESGFEEVSGSR